jgi:hypothetical protein
MSWEQSVPTKGVVVPSMPPIPEADTNIGTIVACDEKKRAVFSEIKKMGMEMGCTSSQSGLKTQ